jgi:hypothetical protein
LLFQVRQRLCSVVVSSSSIRGDLCVCVLCVDLVKL